MKRLLLPLLLSALLVGCQTRGGDGGVRPLDSVTPRDYSDSPGMANVQLGIAYLRKGNLERALNKLRKAVEQDPDLPAAHNALGLLYERLGETERAEEHYRRAANLDRGDSMAQNNYGQFLCKQGRFEEGEQRFLQALANPLYRTPEVAYANAGLCLRKAGDGEKAEEYLRKALQIAPTYAQALLEMARISVERQEFLQARAFLQRYLAVEKQSAETLWLGILTERALGDRDAVASYQLRLKNQFPQSEEARLMRRMEDHER
ncbi:type IV pilus biogenesis/stability protein PilW [Endothiovibrio diazotrophicus]